jgi:hypothetical protein
MTAGSQGRIVLLGMMTKMPVAGNIWLVGQYLEGFRRLGFDAYYVEAHGITPTKLMESPEDDAAERAAAFVRGAMERFGFGDRWCYHARYDGDRYLGLTRERVLELYRTADLIINLHGGTVPLPEHAASGRLVYLETDPVELEIELFNGEQATRDFLAPHTSFLTWGLNYGSPDCSVPLPDDIRFHHSPPPVIVDWWEPFAHAPAAAFTTIGNWKQPGKVVYNGDTYHWSKHFEFLKVIDLPQRTSQPFELALSSSSYTAKDRELLENNGWRVVDSLGFSSDLDAYRAYICGSRGEFTVAKDQNIRLRSGWFSERSAQYLAAGRPVITQDTGFGSYLPTGCGLFPFTSTAEALAAVDAINGDYERHSRRAREIAREYLNFDVVLSDIIAVHAG